MDASTRGERGKALASGPAGWGVDAGRSAAWERGRGMGRCVGRGEAEGENGSDWARVGSERAARFGVGKRESGPWAASGWMGLLLGWVWFWICFSFLIPLHFLKPTLKFYLDSNINLNSNLPLKQKEQCTSMNATSNF